MEQFLKSLPIVLPLVIIQSLPFAIQEWTESDGCKYQTGSAICDFKQWSPPLMDSTFGSELVHTLILININGTIPAGAFIGLNGSLTYMTLTCNSGSTRFSRDIFTPNLQWLTQLYITGCYIDNGLPSRLLESLKGLRVLVMHGTGSVIEGLVSHDTLAGLTNIQLIALNSVVTTGRLPSGFFDGLKTLTTINLMSANLDFIPSNWFNGLDGLKKILLHFNNLRTLPPGLFDELRSLTLVQLHGNPWNCSCELMWLFEWSNITAGDGVVCQSPSAVENAKLEDASGLLNCTESTPTILPTTMSTDTEIKETPTSLPVTTVLATSLQKGRSTSKIFGKPMTSTVIPATFKVIPTATSSIATSATATSVTRTSASTTSSGPIPTASWTASVTNEEGTIQSLFSLSSFSWAKTISVQAYQSDTERESASNTGGTSTDTTVNILYYAVLVSVVGAVLTAAILCRYVCWNKYVGRLTRVNNGEVGRNTPVNQNRH